eukprot:scaffold149_cov383-Prasinococcus_capsulatus_cf.AAC.4
MGEGQDGLLRFAVVLLGAEKRFATSLACNSKPQAVAGTHTTRTRLAAGCLAATCRVSLATGRGTRA